MSRRSPRTFLHECMKIAINCRSFLKDQYTGIGRYAYNLVQFLSEIDRENQYYLYVHKGIFDRKRKVPQLKAPNFHVKVDYLNRGFDKALKDVDIYHSPSPDRLDIDGVRVIVTVHDLIYLTYPQGHTPRTIEETHNQFQQIMVKADKIICVSKSTMADLKRHFNVHPSKMRLVYQGIDRDVFYPLDPPEKNKAREVVRIKGIEDPFILFVGTIEPRKNLAGLVNAFAMLKNKKSFTGKLVVIGMKGWMEGPVFDLIEQQKLKDDIIFLGYLSSQELCYFYNVAEVFVFPSFYEGFGFPIVEAFSCGTPVVTSNISSCPEVAQDAALIVEPHKPEDIAQAIERILEDKEFKRALQQKGFHRALDFSFVNTAKNTLRVYEEVYSNFTPEV